MLVGDYVEDYEVMVPFQALSYGRHTVHAVCPGKKSGDTSAPPSTISRATRPTRKARPQFRLNATFDQVKPEDYDALVLPGGRAPEYIRLNPRVIEIVRHFSKTNNPSLRLPRRSNPCRCRCRRGKKCSAYLQSAPTSPSRRHLVNLAMTEAIVDGNLVTAPAGPRIPPGSPKFLAVLGTRIESNLQTII